MEPGEGGYRRQNCSMIVSPWAHDGQSSLGTSPTALSRLACCRRLYAGATNRPDSIDSALRRAGRFDREIPMGIPSEAARARILRVISGCMRLEGSFDFDEVAKKTPGFVGADLMALMKEAAALAVQRIFRYVGKGGVETASDCRGWMSS